MISFFANNFSPKNYKNETGQFHQHLMSRFAPIFFCQKNTNKNSRYRKAAQNTFFQKRGARKMFVKLKPVVYFTKF